MKIIFYNCQHRGDIHFSRSFAAHTASSILKNNSNIQFLYLHQNSPDTVSDIVDVTEVSALGKYDEAFMHLLGVPTADPNFVIVLDGVDTFGEKIIGINTWVGSNVSYRGDCGCCFVGNQKLWNRIWEVLDQEHCLKVDPPDKIEDLLPKINYKHYSHCSFIDKHLKDTGHQYRKRIFVSNGPVLSNQANNFDFDPIISKASQNHSDCAFYLTDGTSLDAPNIYRTRELIQKDGCDLNENSYLSTFCDVLVGRGSGPFAFASCYDNFMDEDKTFCIFSNDIGEGAWHANGKCKYEWYDPFIQVEKIIENSLGE